jgi:hypothetical protein
MTYLQQLAIDIWFEVHGTRSDTPRTLYLNYALLAITLGVGVTAADVHDAWCVWALTRHPDHPSLRPFDELAPEIRAKDDRYVRAIRRVSERRGLLTVRADREGAS